MGGFDVVNQVRVDINPTLRDAAATGEMKDGFHSFCDGSEVVSAEVERDDPIRLLPVECDNLGAELAQATHDS
jgi:hypothetical protein